MKNILSANTFMMKIYIVVFLFIFSFLTCFSKEDEKTYISKIALQLVKQEASKSNKTDTVIDSLNMLINRNEVSEKSFSQAIYSAGELFRIQGKLSVVIELFQNVVKTYEQINNPNRDQINTLVQFYIPLGAAHEEMGMWSRAMDYYYKALSITEQYEMENSKAKIYNNIGTIYYNRGEYDKSEEYMLSALEINKTSNNKKEISNNYNNLAGIYVYRENYNQALDYALRAIQLLDKENDPDWYYFMVSNIASLYISQKDFNLAYSYLKIAIENQTKYNLSSDLIQTYMLFSKYYEAVGKIDSSRIYIEKSLSQAKKIENKNTESKIQKQLAFFYERTGNYPLAFKALENSSHLNDSIIRADNQRKMDDIEKIYDIEKKMRENELLIKDITLKKLRADRLWILTAFIALLLIVVIFYLITRSRNKEKARRTDELLALQQAALYEKEKELQKQKEQELNYIIDKKNRELTSYTINMVKNHEFITDLNEELKKLLLELNPRDKDHKEHVRQLLNKLHHQNYTSNWEEFHYYFEQVHPSFYNGLEKKYPDLTIKEKRLCAFLRLGLSSKEISSITFKEVRSVESARNRLRKKLGISNEENLTDFLVSIS